MFDCVPIVIVDGDTIRCGEERVRLLGIDAPELAGHCRRGRTCTPGDGAAARAELVRLVGKGRVQCQPSGFDRYGRTLAQCKVGKVDLGCALVRRGAAVERYQRPSCGRAPVRG